MNFCIRPLTMSAIGRDIIGLVRTRTALLSLVGTVWVCSTATSFDVRRRHLFQIKMQRPAEILTELSVHPFVRPSIRPSVHQSDIQVSHFFFFFCFPFFFRCRNSSLQSAYFRVPAELKYPSCLWGLKFPLRVPPPPPMPERVKEFNLANLNWS